MAVAIMYFKSSNIIHDFFDDVARIEEQKIIYKNGSVEGWDTNEIGVLVVGGLKFETEKTQDKECNILIDNNGKKYKIGDKIPLNLIDLSNNFAKKNIDDLSQENEELKRRLLITENALVDLILGGV